MLPKRIDANDEQVDGSLTGENNPIRPLIIPDRQVDFIVVYEASSEGTYSWVNGTSLQSEYLSSETPAAIQSANDGKQIPRVQLQRAAFHSLRSPGLKR